jgi:cell division septation protein DedD
VIFLCGVMVGRGVRADRADGASIGSDLGTGAAAQASTGPAPAAPANPMPASAPPNPSDEASTQDALTEKNPKDTTLASAGKSKAGSPAVAPAPKSAATAKPALEKPAPAEKPTPAAHADAAASKPPAQVAEPAAPGTVASGGFAVQITALRDRSEADAIVKRLAAKGYPAYVVNPLPGKPPVYRVQVGRFAERAEADRAASRLQKEEQFSPWVTR